MQSTSPITTLTTTTIMCHSRSKMAKENQQQLKINGDEETIISASRVNFDFKIETSTKSSERIWLPDNYCVNDYDVLCGRGADCFNHIGNQLFRQLIELNVKKYKQMTTKYEKTAMIREIIISIRNQIPTGCYFLKKDFRTLHYYDIGDINVREKVSQAFRDAIIQQQKSKIHHDERRHNTNYDSDNSNNASNSPHHNMLQTTQTATTLLPTILPQTATTLPPTVLFQSTVFNQQLTTTLTNSYPFQSSFANVADVDDKTTNFMFSILQPCDYTNEQQSSSSWSKSIEKPDNSSLLQHQKSIPTSLLSLHGIPKRNNQSSDYYNSNQNESISNDYFHKNESNLMIVNRNEITTYSDRFHHDVMVNSKSNAIVSKEEIIDDDEIVFEKLCQIVALRNKHNNIINNNDNPYEPIPL